MHDLPNASRDRAKQSATFQIRDKGVRQVQEQLKSVTFALQLRPRAWRCVWTLGIEWAVRYWRGTHRFTEL